MVIRALGQFLVWVWWMFIPHPFVSSGQFSSGICRRCGFTHMRRWM